MKRRLFSFFLFLVIISLVAVLSAEIWKETKPIINQIFSGQINKDDILSPKKTEKNEYTTIISDFTSGLKEDESESETVAVETIEDKKEAEKTEDEEIFSNINTEEKEEVVEEVEIEKTVTTPPPLVVENKYTSGDEEALSDTGIVWFTNIEREKEGLNTLEQNNLLMQAATAKLNHMFDEQYFEHVAPKGGEDVSYWAESVSYEYITVGENLALGNFKNSEDMVIAWMNSPGHRANILKEGYQEIGVAVGYGEFEGDDVWLGVQIFATPLSACPEVDPTLKVQISHFEALTKETEATLSSMQVVLLEAQPETQAEYDDHLIFVEEYNKIVDRHNINVEELRSVVSDYNSQVNAFNSCIATK